MVEQLVSLFPLPDGRELPWLTANSVFGLIFFPLLLQAILFCTKYLYLKPINVAVELACRKSTVYVDDEWYFDAANTMQMYGLVGFIPGLIIGAAATTSPGDVHWHLTTGFTLVPVDEPVLAFLNVGLVLGALLVALSCLAMIHYFGPMMPVVFIPYAIYFVVAYYAGYYCGIGIILFAIFVPAIALAIVGSTAAALLLGFQVVFNPKLLLKPSIEGSLWRR